MTARRRLVVGFRAAALVSAALVSAALVSAVASGSTRAGDAYAVFVCGRSPTSKAAVGSIVSVIRAEVTVDASSAYGGRPLYEGSAVCTNGTGQVSYRLTREGTTYCETGTPAHATRAAVYPSADVAVKWSLGSTWCAGTEGARLRFASIGKLNIHAADSLFGVVIGSKHETTAKVVAGFLNVSGTRTSVIVGPGQEVVVRAGGEPSAAVAAELDGGDRVTIADLQFLVPPGKLPRPTAGDSAALRNILGKKSLIVAYTKESNAKTAAFVKRYFGEIGKSWGVRTMYEAHNSTLALNLLLRKRVNVVAMPTAKTPSTVDAVAFFTVGDTPWQIAIVRDKAYGAATRASLLASLNTGRYAAAYRASFGVEPSYTALRTLLFPP